MPTLDELLRSQATPGSPGSSPELEQMLGRVAQMGGGGAPMAAGAPANVGPGPAPTAQGAPMTAPQASPGAPMQPEQANMTYQMLIRAGLPPEVAKQALQEPKFLQEILMELQKRQLGAPPQSQAPQAGAAGQAQRPAPPMA